MTEQQNRVVNFALSKIGCGYIYGATGWICTTARRQQQAAQYPDQANKILNVGKKWDGKECYDCAQLVKHAVASGGGFLPSGANSQFNESPASWLDKGWIDTMPDEPGIILYRLDAKGKAQHTGVYIGGGDVVDARGTAEGVMCSKLKDHGWTHWAKPILGATGVVDWENQTYSCNTVVRTKTGSGIGLWESPSNTGKKVKSIPEGSVVTVVEKPTSNGFAVACYDSAMGYADTQYLFPVDLGRAESPNEPVGNPDEPAKVPKNLEMIGSNTFQLKTVRFTASPAVGQVTLPGGIIANDEDYIVEGLPGSPYVVKYDMFRALCLWVAPDGSLKEI